MRIAGITGLIRGGKRRTTIVEPTASRPPDLVDRRFAATGPNRLWVSDITYVRTWEGWAYVAFVTDVFSRQIVGWQLASCAPICRWTPWRWRSASGSPNAMR